MVQTWKTGKAGDFVCPHCSSVYETTIYRSPARDKDSATCAVCHKVMHEWNSTSNPRYTLKSRGVA